jgi:hypothetical protein
LSWEQRQALLPKFTADIKLLETVLGEDFGDWLAPRDRSGGMVGARPPGQATPSENRAEKSRAPFRAYGSRKDRSLKPLGKPVHRGQYG